MTPPKQDEFDQELVPQNMRAYIEQPGELNSEGEEVGDKVVPMEYERPKPQGGKLNRREMKQPFNYNPEPPDDGKRKTLRGGQKQTLAQS